uniref:Uncharacterized protein n=1 Tax=Theropithecus gelada TaxID=9565 RepID=A0A8D2K761_THEGE
ADHLRSGELSPSGAWAAAGNSGAEPQLLEFFFFFKQSPLPCHPGWCAVERSQLTATSASRVQAILLPLLPSSWDYRREPPHWLIFVFLIEGRV